MKKIIIFLFLLLLIHGSNAYAQNIHNINFQSITTDDGLSQSLAEYIYISR